jgi:hypothetical protein
MWIYFFRIWGTGILNDTNDQRCDWIYEEWWWKSLGVYEKFTRKLISNFWAKEATRHCLRLRG